jgi:hypothetical protein
MTSERWTWDAASRRYRDETTGRWLSHGKVATIRNDFAATQRAWADTAASALARKDWTVRRWELEIRDRLKRVFLAEYMLGRGGTNVMTQADYGAVGRMLKDQYDFLRGFAEDVQAGAMTEAQIASRTQLYHESAIQAFERGKAEAYGIPTLPAYPADGRTRCLTGDVIVDGIGIERGFRRPYDGDIVRLETAGGKVLTVTPNHPVLTDRGWVRAGLLKQGDDVVCGRLRQPNTGRQLDPYSTPATISEVCGALERLSCNRKPLSAMDFHGDGRYGYVDVVGADRFLRSDTAASLLQPRRDLRLSDPYSGERTLSRQRLIEALVVTCLTSANSDVRMIGERSLLFERHASHAQNHRFATGTRIDTEFAKTADDRMARDVVFSGDLIDASAVMEALGNDLRFQVRTGDAGFPIESVSVAAEPTAYNDPRDAEAVAQSIDAFTGIVVLDKVVFADVQSFHGDVFNLQTAEGWYSANGIIVHNCRSRCRCRWRITEQKTTWKAYWIVSGRAESCSDCLTRRALYNPHIVSKVLD